MKIGGHHSHSLLEDTINFLISQSLTILHIKYLSFNKKWLFPSKIINYVQQQDILTNDQKKTWLKNETKQNKNLHFGISEQELWKW